MTASAKDYHAQAKELLDAAIKDYYCECPADEVCVHQIDIVARRLSALYKAEQARDALRETLVRVLHVHANRAHFHVEHSGTADLAVVTHFNCDGDPALTEAFTLLGWPNPVKVEDAK